MLSWFWFVTSFSSLLSLVYWELQQTRQKTWGGRSVAACCVDGWGKWTSCQLFIWYRKSIFDTKFVVIADIFTKSAAYEAHFWHDNTIHLRADVNHDFASHDLLYSLQFSFAENLHVLLNTRVRNIQRRPFPKHFTQHQSHSRSHLLLLNAVTILRSFSSARPVFQEATQYCYGGRGSTWVDFRQGGA